ncbi:hypothetical protein [Cyanothece sp. BG0011]|uniref:hypothetical protein n=1 Tax=Cyanothece sp. BG0011 TaxID=2082950 RepID=UPI00130030A8|nr:hypothetical protein [Cyanothece sp. BG0011]
MTTVFSNIFPGQAVSPTPPSSTEVCEIITSMTHAENTDKLLSLLDTNRSEITQKLIAMKRNMEQYEAEGYGWQNVLDSSSGLEPRPGSWLLGALRMACED